jgi:hypothetical protein
MGQERLDSDQVRWVDGALRDICRMCSWADTADGRSYWEGVRTRLIAMRDNKTTDGKPYVDPEPPIPDGYRKAVAGDEGRTDCMFWSRVQPKWCVRDPEKIGERFCQTYRYIVPVDKAPTDEDSKGRPVVMVRDYHDEQWKKATLYGVIQHATHYSFLVASPTASGRFKFCRHLYPNETP